MDLDVGLEERGAWDGKRGRWITACAGRVSVIWHLDARRETGWRAEERGGVKLFGGGAVGGVRSVV